MPDKKTEEVPQGDQQARGTEATGGEDAAGVLQRPRVTQTPSEALHAFVEGSEDFVAAALVDRDFVERALANRELLEGALALLSSLKRAVASPDARSEHMLATSPSAMEEIPSGASREFVAREAPLSDVVSYNRHIWPLFRPIDVLCMLHNPDPSTPVRLASYEWLSIRANYESVHGAVSAGWMPPDRPWSERMVATLEAWAAGGFKR